MRLRDSDTAVDRATDAVLVAHAIAFLDQGPDRETLTQLLKRVSNRLGIRIEVSRTISVTSSLLTGFLYRSSKCAHILVRQSDPLTYQSRCILHEVGHLLLEHQSCAGITQPASRSPLTVVDSLLAVSALPLSSDGETARDVQNIEAQAEAVARAAERRLLVPRYARDEASWGGL